MVSRAEAIAILILVCIAIVAIPICMVGCPMYSVYVRRKSGEGQLAEAESNRMIATVEAQAKEEAARLLAKADVERAKGVAEANKIIGDSLRGNEAYLRWLWINALGDSSGQVIYVPTEAGLPILEAGRHQLNRHAPPSVAPAQPAGGAG